MTVMGLARSLRGTNIHARFLQISCIFFMFLLLVPLQTPFTDPEFVDPTFPEAASSNPSLSEGMTSYTGTGPALPVSYSGTARYRYDSSILITSSSPDIGSITLDSGWTGTDLQAQINDLRIDVDNTKNWNLNSYHLEKWIIDPYEGDDVYVPDSWALTKSVGGSETSHPRHGTMEFNTVSGAGYSGTQGWRFDSNWGSSYTFGTNDEIYISQMIHTPYREIHSASITLRYYVLSTSTMNDKAHIVARFAGYETDLHVFESGDSTDSWQQTTVTIPTAYIDSLTMPNSFLVDVGLQMGVSGFQTGPVVNEVYIDDIQVNLNVRPFPEQVGLKVNGTAVVGATQVSVYPYVPDGANRDAYSDIYTSPSGIDLDGWLDNGNLYTGIWGGSWADTYTYQSGYQFPLNIPQGAVITSAYFEGESSGAEGISPDIDMRIYSASRTTGGSPISNFTVGLPTMPDRYSWVDYSVDWNPLSWTSPVRIQQRSPDLAPLIQKIVTDSTWTSGDFVLLMFDYMYSTSYQAEVWFKGSYGYQQTELCRLNVEYMIPLPQDTVPIYQYKKDFTIDYTKVAATLSNFPVLVDIYDADLKTDVQADGADIAFRLGNQALEFEIESFDQSFNTTHAHLVAWVKVPTLSSTANTVISMVYGDANALPTTSTGVWNEYAVVHHLDEDPSGTIHDSTSGNHDGTSYGTQGSEDSVSGRISGAIDFDLAQSDMIGIGQVNTDAWTGVTMSAWIRQDINQDCRVFSKSNSTDSSFHIMTLRIDDYYNSGTGLWEARPSVRIRTDGTGGGGSSFTSTAQINLGQWHYLVWRWSAADATLLLYLDGNQIGSWSRDGDSISDST
ncbi:MAG: DUF2341 domain-containing protein, partial [Candidatus Sifarchaeia archaeon]